MAAMSNEGVKIAALAIYPVKSCRGISLERALITATGFEHDREWMVVRPDGRFLTQREEPRLALVETALVADSLQLRAPQAGVLTVPQAMTGPEVEVTCWRDRCAAFDAGDEAAAWLTEHLRQPARLVRFDARRKRPSDTHWTQGVEAFSQFADGYAWLITSQASLDDLNSRLPAPLPMNRFRPNIVLEGLPAFGEDDVYELAADGVRLRVVKPCTRCVITTTNQLTAEREGNEPLRALREYRFSRMPQGVLFGQNAILIEGAGRSLQAGERLEVTRRELRQ
jgi:uncharacterized protein